MPAVADEQARALATEILARPEYARWRADDWGILETLLGWIKALRDWMAALSDAHPVLYIFALAVLFAICFSLIGHIVWSVQRALRMPVPDATSPEAPPPTYMQDAACLAGQGRFLEAAHRVRLAALRLLLDRGVIELSRFEPNRVLRRRLAQADVPEAERQSFVALLGRLERAWFRDRTEDQALYRDWCELHASLQRRIDPA